MKKREKKTEHTRMYAQLCSSQDEIFTSVVVYSRTTTKQPSRSNKPQGMQISCKLFEEREII